MPPRNCLAASCQFVSSTSSCNRALTPRHCSSAGGQWFRSWRVETLVHIISVVLQAIHTRWISRLIAQNSLNPQPWSILARFFLEHSASPPTSSSRSSGNRPRAGGKSSTTWTLLSFFVQLTDATIGKTKKTYKNALAESKKKMKDWLKKGAFLSRAPLTLPPTGAASLTRSGRSRT